MTKEYPSTKSKKNGYFPGNQAGSLVIRSSGFIWIWVFRHSALQRGVTRRCGRRAKRQNDLSNGAARIDLKPQSVLARV